MHGENGFYGRPITASDEIERATKLETLFGFMCARAYLERCPDIGTARREWELTPPHLHERFFIPDISKGSRSRRAKLRQLGRTLFTGKS